MGDVLKVLVQQLLLRIAYNLTQGLVDLQPAPLDPYKGHPDRCVLKRTFETLFTLAQRFLGPFALGDVAKSADDLPNIAVRVQLRLGVYQKPDPILKSGTAHAHNYVAFSLSTGDCSRYGVLFDRE